MTANTKEKTRIGGNRAGFIVKRHIDQLVDRILKEAFANRKRAL